MEKNQALFREVVAMDLLDNAKEDFKKFLNVKLLILKFVLRVKYIIFD